MTSSQFFNTVRITADGFKCERCGAKATAPLGAIMSAYMREVIAFENTHKACASKPAQQLAGEADEVQFVS